MRGAPSNSWGSSSSLCPVTWEFANPSSDDQGSYHCLGTIHLEIGLSLGLPRLQSPCCVEARPVQRQTFKCHFLSLTGAAWHKTTTEDGCKAWTPNPTGIHKVNEVLISCHIAKIGGCKTVMAVLWRNSMERAMPTAQFIHWDLVMEKVGSTNLCEAVDKCKCESETEVKGST